MSKQEIPDAAVEAAWQAFREHRATRSPGNGIAAMREALEAAAPHMLPDADPVVAQILRSTRWA